ncbi:MAG: hypothetical protein CR982_08570 [Candidatus Cloacimonadota bacterium]|nr:MAG: hypothetical protein CR982_08570 [Candidatus Cloacimonadota bacterium]PIE78686.1 MAG: hypothetical protein CSA15_06495 [Candidatus Delongbacteria bacterium]
MKKLLLFLVATLMLTFISCGDNSSTSSSSVDRIMRAKIIIGDSGEEEYLSNEKSIKLRIGAYHQVGAFPINGSNDPIFMKYWYLQFNPQVDGNFNLVEDTLRFSEDPSGVITFKFPEGEGADTTYAAGPGVGIDFPDGKDLTIVFKNYDQNEGLIEGEFSGWIKNELSGKWYEVDDGYFRTNVFEYGE